MNTLPWRKPEEKLDPMRETPKVFALMSDGFIEECRDHSLPPNVVAYVSESDLLSDFQRWQNQQVQPSPSWKDVPDPDKWLRDVRGYEDESGEDRG